MGDKTSKTTKSQSERLDQAAQNLEEILKKIAPYAKPMEVEEYSTTGKWQAILDGSNVGTALTQDVFDSILRRVSRPLDESQRVAKKNQT